MSGNENEVTAQEAPKVTMADIEAEILGETYFTAADGILGAYHSHGSVYQGTRVHDDNYGRLTLCVVILRNGFMVVGESACADLANFNEELGRTAARKNAVDKLWSHLGFRLRDKLTAESQS